MLVENTDYRQEVLDLENPFDCKLVKDFLEPLGFKFRTCDLTYTMILYNLNDEIIGTGSLHDNVLKFVVVSPKFRSTTAFALIVTHLTETALKKNKTVFVFTRPKNIEKFMHLGYSEIASAPPIYTLLEFGYKTIKDYKKYLLSKKHESNTTAVAAIVVNCNPFTNGHKYLIETAAKESRLVYLFVVEEDKSVFDFCTRWMLIEKGISHLKNVVMIKGGKYVVSSATFPIYFLKNEAVDEITQKQTELDVAVFAKHIAPVLGISKRYVGTENYCTTTANYNLAMKKILTEQGIEIIELKRKAIGPTDNYISASKVRNAIKNNRLNDILDFLPDSTKKFLRSEDSAEIRNKICCGNSRH